MNILAYTLQLNDRMSSTLSRVGASSVSTTRDVRNLNSEVNALNRTNLGGFMGAIRSAFSLIPALGIGATLGKTISMGMDQEMRNVSFEVLFKGEDNAKKMIDDISNYAAKSPYGKTELSQATQVMAGFGIEQERIMPNMKAIGDIAMGDKNKLNSLTLAFAQMSSTGKLTGQDLLQMINAGFNPLEQMSKTTGKSIAQLKDDMAKGKIGSDMVTQAFQDATSKGGMFYGMTEKISNTSGGQWSTALDNISEKLLGLYNNVIQPVLLPGLKIFNQFLSDPITTIGKIGDKIMNLNPVLLGFGGVVLSVAAAIGIVKVATIAYATVTKMITFFKGIETAAWWANNAAMLANPVTWIVAGVIALIAVIAFLIIKVDGWGEMWQHTVNGAKLLFQAFTESAKFYFNTMINGLMIGLNKIKQGWYEFKEAVGIGDSTENQNMLAQIQADTDARKKAITDGAKNIVDLGLQAKDEFAKAAGSLKFNDTGLSDVVGGMKKTLGIETPGVPGMSGGDGTGGGTGTGGGKAGKDTANSIATGGSKTTHITVQIAEMGNDMKIYVDSVKEGAENIRDIVLEYMTRALTMAQGQIQ